MVNDHLGYGNQCQGKGNETHKPFCIEPIPLQSVFNSVPNLRLGGHEARSKAIEVTLVEIDRVTLTVLPLAFLKNCSGSLMVGIDSPWATNPVSGVRVNQRSEYDTEVAGSITQTTEQLHRFAPVAKESLVNQDCAKPNSRRAINPVCTLSHKLSGHLSETG
jgi:hypothetical protein